MSKESQRPLKVFLCHASGDKPQVRVLYKRLVADGVDAWLDQEKLLPGQDWRVEIPRAVKEADVVVICLSNKSITKEGYVQKEIKFALDIAEEKPEGSIFLIPARLEECPVPDQMSRWQWVDLYEENGFIKLLRSLKLRADKVGAVIEPSSQVEDDKDIERRLNQLYTEGLAAFYTEDWDRACHRFQTILSERPNHKNATEKLEEAQRQRDLAKLYLQATEAYRSENWEEAIKALEEIYRKSSDYKDVSQLLRNAKKQEQLGEFYAEAKTLHSAQKWQAVLKVFDQISVIDPAYQDPDGLLPSAQKEMTELKRLTELNELYSIAVREMEASHWYEARKSLEQVHKSQTGFLDTERLLRKVENEITKLEDQRKRTAQVQMLYEQARKMARANQWGKALAQMEEIHKLDGQFVDSDGILEKSKVGLAHEDQATQQRKDLAALYAEAVSLLDAKRYQEALEKWNAVQTIDPAYKDTSRVRVTARKKLDELSRPEKTEGAWSLVSRIKALRTTPKAVAIPNRDRGDERMILLSFAVTVIIHLFWRVIVNWTQIIDSVVGGFVLLFLLAGLYGLVLSFVYKKVIPAWSKQSSWIQIIGWALGAGIAAVVVQYFDVMFNNIFMLVALPASALAMRQAKISAGRSGIVFISWGLAWFGGNTLGNYLAAIFDTGYTWVMADALTIFLGLLFTFGALTEHYGKILRAALWGALGFALGNFINSLPFWDTLSSLPVEVFFVIWGLTGGAILEAPSRSWRRILFSAVLCGAGLLVSSYLANRILPTVVGEVYTNTFPGRLFILMQILYGMGLGLAIGFLIRRASATGVLILLGAGMYMLTIALNVDVLQAQNIWTGTLRGALIGLLLGFGYGFMGEAKQTAIKAETTN